MLRRLLRRVERCVPRQRRARHRGRPCCIRQAAADQSRAVSLRPARRLLLAAVLGVVAVALVVPLGFGVAGAARGLRRHSRPPTRSGSSTSCSSTCSPSLRSSSCARSPARWRSTCRSRPGCSSAPGCWRCSSRWASDVRSWCSSSRVRRLAVVSSTATPSPLIDQFVGIVASATIVAYALYTFTARDSRTLMITIPYVVFGVFRYILLLHRQDMRGGARAGTTARRADPGGGVPVGGDVRGRPRGRLTGCLAETTRHGRRCGACRTPFAPTSSRSRRGCRGR